MIELLITILLACGMYSDPVDGRYKVNQDVIQKVESAPTFNDLGGEAALNNIVIAEDVDPKE